MVMEIMTGGELFDYVVEKGTLSEEEASGFIRQITSAIAHMHKAGVIHRDLKPENLLLKNKSPNGVVKIIDFGLAKVVIPQSLCTVCMIYNACVFIIADIGQPGRRPHAVLSGNEGLPGPRDATEELVR